MNQTLIKQKYPNFDNLKKNANMAAVTVQSIFLMKLNSTNDRSTDVLATNICTI